MTKTPTVAKVFYKYICSNIKVSIPISKVWFAEETIAKELALTSPMTAVCFRMEVSNTPSSQSSPCFVFHSNGPSKASRTGHLHLARHNCHHQNYNDNNNNNKNNNNNFVRQGPIKRLWLMANPGCHDRQCNILCLCLIYFFIAKSADRLLLGCHWNRRHHRENGWGCSASGIILILIIFVP